MDFINVTNIVLLPKTVQPLNMANFRPISLCTILYKISSKNVANRSQQAQSSFVPGCLISNNVLLAYEILHSLKQKRTKEKCLMALKLDMSKAYDRVE
ncbi:reverse transcriptase [Gossypium australe]|uniref:Reverse transcriptase n=1 Tax=Gossypium australe TaxID=47621 RepID=A0A5B6UYG5_9ROSI|nr:reverse transcriptase [Gossypium australe]